MLKMEQFKMTSEAGEIGAEALFTALDNGNMTEVNSVLDKYAESVDYIINKRDDEGRVPLHYAADCADLQVFQRVLSLNRSLMDLQDQLGFTPLMVAVMAGNLEILEYLIEQGAQMDQLDRDKHSPVHWAVVCGQLEALICLLRNGAPLNIGDIHGAHPLHYATVIEDVSPERAESILHVLLKEGALTGGLDVDGRTPILWAASNGNDQAFRSLVQAGANKFVVDRDRLGVLHCAGSHGHTEIVRLMLELSPNAIINVKDKNCDTPLFYAATFGHYECTKFLLEKGADPNHLDRRLRTTAHCAASKGQLRILKLLRQYGASFEFQNYRGDLPFHEAVQTCSKEIVEWMLDFEQGFITAANFYGRKALHLAAASGNMELVVLLCQRNAQINPLMLYKNELATPLDLAKRRGHDLIVEYLTVRHDALTAAEISQEKRNYSRQSIEEQLKTAKLRKIRAELSARSVSLELENVSENGLKKYRRGKSALGRKGDPQEKKTYADVGTMVSRRSSSASGVLKSDERLPKATSTTDLRKFNDIGAVQNGSTNQANIRVNSDDRAGANPSLTLEKGNSEVDKHHLYNFGGIEETIQKMVQKELAKTTPQNHQPESELDNQKPVARTRRRWNKEVDLESESLSVGSEKFKKQPDVGNPAFNRSDNVETIQEKHKNNLRKKDDGKHQEGANDEDGNENEMAKIELGKSLNGVALNIHGNLQSNIHQKTETPNSVEVRHRIQQKKVKLAVNSASSEEQSNDEIRPRSRRRLKSPPAITELHIFEEGVSPTEIAEHSLITFGAATRRFIHEKAVFEELTHLKRMQIQYGKVQEEVLVRSLVSNFCKQFALHPQHFRRIKTFQHWEKFLYDLLSDQLKMIYLEERDRIHLAALNAAQRAAVIAGYSRPFTSHQRVFAMGNSHASVSIPNNPKPVGRLHSKFDGRLIKISPLDTRLQELNRIYSAGSTSRSTTGNSSAIANTSTRRRQIKALERAKNEHTAKSFSNMHENFRRKPWT